MPSPTAGISITNGSISSPIKQPSTSAGATVAATSMSSKLTTLLSRPTDITSGTKLPATPSSGPSSVSPLLPPIGKSKPGSPLNLTKPSPPSSLAAGASRPNAGSLLQDRLTDQSLQNHLSLSPSLLSAHQVGTLESKPLPTQPFIFVVYITVICLCGWH